MTYGVILAGGSGTRLWPLSTKDRPKQFLKLFSDFSMIEDTSNRILSRIPIDRQYVLTGESYAHLVKACFGDSINILVEPAAKNTAPCILWAAMTVCERGGGVMAVLPSDHLIRNEDNFIAALDTAVRKAKEGGIVTFGILPDRAETGYGYMEISGSDFKLNKSVKKIVTFREKPDLNTAESYIEAGNFLWNSGMFVFDSHAIIEEFKLHCPEVYNAFHGKKLSDAEYAASAFADSPSISIDYAVMEKTENGYCIPADFGWNDVGSFISVYNESPKDSDYNAGDVFAFDSKGCYVSSEKPVVLAGVNDIIVADGEDVILVADMKKSPEIGNIAKIFNDSNR